MTPDWTPLRRALRRARRQSADLPFWWRDDDAISDTAGLSRLVDLSISIQVPVHLAIIPGFADQTLQQAVSATGTLVPVVHGWRHENHAPPGTKKSEYGQERPEMLAELSNGTTLLQQMFGDTLVPLFVPPWNRFDETLLSLLRKVGFHGISAYGPRSAPLAAPGILRINAHIDPIDWRGTRGLHDPEKLVKRTARMIKSRLEGRADAAEPLGYLTHHLAHDDALWSFSRMFLSELLEGGAKVQPIKPLLEAVQ